MADEAAVVEEGARPAENPLVAVTFQKNLHRAQKYLEGEPKALGVTQVCLSVFQISIISAFVARELSPVEGCIPFLVTSPLVVIAGCVAVAAKSLHLPTLRACLAMQIVSCVASIVNLMCSLTQVDMAHPICWHYYYDNISVTHGEHCQAIEHTHSHFFAEFMIIQAALFAISATLAAYSCKVVNCCTPAPKMTVITVQAPAVQQ